MTTEDRTRHDRIRTLFPRAYATSSRDSVLGVLLDALAEGLRGLDHATERALRNKWLATAEAPREPVDSGISAPARDSAARETLMRVELGGAPRPLEQIGSALDLLRQPWEVDPHAYRARIAALAPLMTRGLATPRVLLSFTIGALGGEPCPRLEWDGDGTTAIGLPPGRLARCRACRGGRRRPAGPCPLRADATMSASLVDNPRRVVRLEREAVPTGNDEPAQIHFDSDSLFHDRPELELRVPAGNTPRFEDSRFDVTSFPELRGQIVPSFRSRQTNERIVVVYALAPGDTLTILPHVPYDPDVPPHQQRWVDRPTSANPFPPVVRVNGRDVDAPVIVFHGVTFDGARFGIDRFAPDSDAPRFDAGHFDLATFDQAAAAGRLEATTPTVVPGANTWDYTSLDAGAVAAVLASLPPETPLPPAPVVDTTNLPPVTLRLRWWTRPVSRFLLRIPSTPAVRESVALGAASYVRHMVERVRPVGVEARVDFLEPPFREVLEPSDGLGGATVSLAEDLSPADDMGRGMALPTETLDGLDLMAFRGIFDVTPFELTVLAE